MKPNISKTRLIDFLSGLFVLLFVYAACSKLHDFQKFQVQIGKSPLLSSFSGLVPWSVPVIEIIISILLIWKRLQLLGLYAFFTMMVIFSAYIIVILNYSEYIPCSCGGILENMNWIQHFWFNTVFVLLAAGAVLIYPDNYKELVARREVEAQKP